MRRIIVLGLLGLIFTLSSSNISLAEPTNQLIEQFTASGAANDLMLRSSCLRPCPSAGCASFWLWDGESLPPRQGTCTICKNGQTIPITSLPNPFPPPGATPPVNFPSGPVSEGQCTLAKGQCDAAVLRESQTSKPAATTNIR